MNRKAFFCLTSAMLLSAPVSGETLSRFQAAMIEARKGNPAAQNKVGAYYQIGIGTDQNNTEAARWFRAAAEQEYAEAQFNLAEMYEEGKGVVQDMETALSWYKKACGNGWKCGCRKYHQLTEERDSDCN
ncbi:MAG: sel1 repeat family protein [Chlorobiaceae bacterium]|nr:sel1 repeat family protein [Chlorobiaceae bacterium]